MDCLISESNAAREYYAVAAPLFGKGRELLVTHAAAAPLGWLIFVELPVDEANALAQ